MSEIVARLIGVDSQQDLSASLVPPGVAKLVNPLRFVQFRVEVKSRHALIAEMAYLRAERRGFLPGYDVADWLAAEAELDNR